MLICEWCVVDTPTPVCLQLDIELLNRAFYVTGGGGIITVELLLLQLLIIFVVHNSVVVLTSGC